MGRLTVRVTHHGTCHHDAESWSHAFSMAINHAKVSINPQSRMPAIKVLMAGKDLWHAGVHFTGKIL
jgi:imidazoleglycerol phosphate dehydratase HisB